MYGKQDASKSCHIFETDIKVNGVIYYHFRYQAKGRGCSGWSHATLSGFLHRSYIGNDLNTLLVLERDTSMSYGRG